jgi:ketol-acid reductoisomerase
MGDHRQKRIEEIAAEITGPIVEAIITAGANGNDERLSDTAKAKAIGEAARVIYEMVFTGVLASLKPGTSSALPKPGELLDRVTGKPVLASQE